MIINKNGTTENSVQISAWQLMALILLGRIVVAVTYTGGAAGVAHGTDRMAAILLEAAVILLLFLPTAIFARQGKGLGTLDYAYVQFGRIGGAAVAVLYAVYCLYIQILDLVQFENFASNSLSPQLPRVILSIALVSAAFIAAFYGLEAVARTAAIVVFFMVIAVVFLGLSLIPDMESINFPPLFYDGLGPVWKSVLENLPRFLELGVIGLLVPHVSKGGVGRGFSFGVLVSAAVVLLMQCTVVGVLGDYSEMVNFPYYTTVTLARSSILQRMDIIVTAVWVAGIFVKMALFSVLYLGCLRRAFGEKGKVVYVLAGGALVLTVGLMLGGRLIAAEHRMLWLFSTLLLLLLTVALPIVLLMANAIRERRAKGL